MIHGQLSLEGIRVLDLSRALAGPYCAMVLGDLGADVIKVENPDGGDETRGWKPPDVGGESGYYLSANRNKRSVAIDLRSEEGAPLVHSLADHSDVLIHNFSAEVVDRYGLGHETLLHTNPGLVYCRIAGFAAESRYAHLPGYDFVMQAMSGLMSVTGTPDGEPQKVGVALVDVLCGLHAGNAILGALIGRERTGLGCHIDLPLFDTAVASLVNVASNFLISGEPPLRWGNAHANLVPYQPFATADGQIAIGIGNDSQFVRLCIAMDLSAVAGDPRFRTNTERMAHRSELVDLLREEFRRRSLATWLEVLRDSGIPCAPIQSLDAVFDDPYTDESGLVSRVAHPTAGEIPMVSSPVFVDGSRLPIIRHPPRLGEHTTEVLTEVLGLSPRKIAQLWERKTFG